MVQTRVLRVVRIAAAVLAAIAATPVLGQSPATAQSQKANKEKELGVDVTVADPTNAVIRKAKVILSRGRDTASIAVSTDSRGVARFRGGPRGTCQIIVEAPGFRTVQQSVTMKKMEHLRVKLEIAVRTETVEVMAAPVVIDTVVNVTGEPLPYFQLRTVQRANPTLVSRFEQSIRSGSPSSDLMAALCPQERQLAALLPVAPLPARLAARARA
jgi:hypothetical protein